MEAFNSVRGVFCLLVFLLLFILICFTVTDWPHTLLSSFGEPTLEVDKEIFLMLGVLRTPNFTLQFR